jgi:hypothetical protein
VVSLVVWLHTLLCPSLCMSVTLFGMRLSLIPNSVWCMSGVRCMSGVWFMSVVLFGTRMSLAPNSATDIHQLGHNNICGHTTKLTTPMYFY